MESKKKKTLFNVIMVVLILVIAGCGVMAVGNLKGWFDKGSNSILVSKNVKGVANIQRSGVGYGLEKNVSLRAGDILETKNGTTAELSAGDKNILSLNANTTLTADSVEKDSLKLNVGQGEVFGDFADSVGETELSFDENTLTFETGVFSVSAQSGSSTVYVFKDEIDLEGADGSSSTVEAGESAQIAKDEDGVWKTEVNKISAASLNEYMIRQLLGCEDKNSLCFTADELQKVLDDRAAEKKAALEKSLSSANKIPKTSDPSTSSDSKKDGDEDKSGSSGNSSNTGSTDGNTVTEYTPESADNTADTEDNADDPADDGTIQDNSDGAVQDDSDGDITSDGSGDTSTDPGDVSGDGSADADNSGSTDNSGNDSTDNNDSSSDENTDSNDNTDNIKQCTITIRCDTILDNMDDLTSGKEAYVPSNGIILDTSTVEFTEGETVFDVLQRVCDYAGIQLEYSWTPMYDSYYIQGINNLYEFDCGAQSGWMYKVNGWFPNYGCSKYTLEDGDDIVWCFTCNGLGEDVGAEYMG